MDDGCCFIVRTLLNLRDSIAADKTFNSTSFIMSCRLNDAAKIRTFFDMKKNILLVQIKKCIFALQEHKTISVMSMTKGLQRFETRLNYFREDLELVDLVVVNKEKLRGVSSIINNSNDGKHPLLNGRKANSNSRGLITRHLRKTVFVSFMKDMHEEVSEYFQYLLKQGALAGISSGQLIGEHKVDIDANRLLQMNDRSDIAEYISAEIYRKLENEKSTSKLLEKINNKLGLKVPQPVIDSALPFMDLRHIFVHRDGKPDSDFRLKYPSFAIDTKGRIALDIALINLAYDKIHHLLKEFDKRMISKRFVGSSEVI